MASDLHKYSVQESLNLMMNTGEDALKVDIDNVTLITEGSDVNIEVHIDQAEDSILAYGYDGSSNQKIKTDASGNVQVDIVSGTTATTEYSEDAATPSTISGISVMMERDNALGGLTPAEGDWAALRCDANGALWTRDDALDAVVSGSEMQVDIVSGNVTNAGTFAVQVDGSALTALQLIDDTVATLGTSTYSETSTKGNVVGAVRNDTLAALAGTDNEIAPLQVNATGALYVDVAGGGVLESAVDGIETLITSTNSKIDTFDAVLDAMAASLALLDNAIPSGNELQVDVVTMPSVTVDSEFPAAGALSDDSSNPTTTSVGSHLMGYDSGNTNWNRVEVDDVGHLQVDVLSTASHAVTNAGTFAVQADLGANNDVRIESGQVKSGAIASGALASGAVASGAVASGAIASGAVASGAVASGAIASGAIASGAIVDVPPSDGHGAVAQFTTNIAGSATQLDAHACKHADVMGKIANVGIVYVGGSSVAATTGIALYPGDVYSVDVTNTNLLYGIAVNANDDLQVVYYN